MNTTIFKIQESIINKQNKYFIFDNCLNYNKFNYQLKKENYNDNFKNKLPIFKCIIDYVNNNQYKLYLPIILDNVETVFKTIYNIDYNLYSISIFSNKFIGNYIINNTNKKLYATFKIKPQLRQDLYDLYILNNNIEEFYDIALINSYITSVFMNKLFRKIKENKNLDYLEESDSEDEFENTDIDKFVYLDKTFNIDCYYSFKFKKWVPEKISKNNIIEKNNLNLITKKKNINNIYKNDRIS